MNQNPIGLETVIESENLEGALAPNVVRIDTDARGGLFVGQAVPQTMRSAATATLSRGYSHFRIENAGVQQGAEYAGTFNSSQATVTAFSNGPFLNGSIVGSGTSTPVMRATAHSAATVVMFHANEPGAEGAFDAAQVLKQYGG